MKDNYLREQLIKTGIINEDCWGETDSFKRAESAGNWYKYTRSRELEGVKLLQDKFNALLEYLKLEEVLIPAKGASYTFKKKGGKK